MKTDEGNHSGSLMNLKGGGVVSNSGERRQQFGPRYQTQNWREVDTFETSYLMCTK